MRLFSYVVTHDTGFSPNPFWGYCTLADCKPAIRRTASVGDWIVGLSPKKSGNRMIYAMQVSEILPYRDYYYDERFAPKIPDLAAKLVVSKCGDNIYQPLPDGGFRQLQSMHSDGLDENLRTKMHDLGGRNVLIARRFHYFGSRALELPEELYELKVGRAHKNNFPGDTLAVFLNFIADKPDGVVAPPSQWPVGDQSWRCERS